MNDATKEGLKEYFAGWLEELVTWRAASADRRGTGIRRCFR